MNVFGGEANSVSNVNGALAIKHRPSTIFLLILASLMLTYIPVVNLLIGPLNTFVTTLHEMSHAFACILTGGHVDGMTIVADGLGHGGLTFCVGGNSLLVTSAGYLGTALIGCLLILLGSIPRLSKGILVAVGSAIALSSLTFMVGSVAHGIILQGLGSMFWGGMLSAFLIWCGLKLKVNQANLLVLFLGVQTGLNALADVAILIQQSAAGGAAFSDATNMAQLTGIPAIFWALLWSALAIAMLGVTMWIVYKPGRKSSLSKI